MELIIQGQNPAFLLGEEKKVKVLRGYCGVREFKKVFVPRVIPMAMEVTIVMRRSHARTIRPRQWPITRGGHTVEKELRKGVSPNMIEGVMAATTFNTSHQTS